MATVGHALVGLSLAAVPAGPRAPRLLRAMWPGLLVLCAYLVDFVEWLTAVAGFEPADTHFVTHSTWYIPAMIALAWLLVFLIARRASPLAYLAAALAVASHWAMDDPRIKSLLVRLYHEQPARENPRLLLQSVEAELWLYGLLLVIGLLARKLVAVRAGPRRLIIPAFCLALVVATFASRSRLAWPAAYLIALMATLAPLARTAAATLLASVVPVLPLLVMLAGELWAERLESRANSLYVRHDYPAAIEAIHRSLDFPTRRPRGWTYVHLGQSFWALGDTAAAEAAFQKAGPHFDDPGWAHYWLAYFYSSPSNKGTPYDRPDEAARLFRNILETPSDDPDLHRLSRLLLERITSSPAAGP